MLDWRLKLSVNKNKEQPKWSNLEFQLIIIYLLLFSKMDLKNQKFSEADPKLIETYNKLE